MDAKRKEKLAIWCNVLADHIISAPDVESIYDIPIVLVTEQYLQYLDLMRELDLDVAGEFLLAGTHHKTHS